MNLEGSTRARSAPTSHVRHALVNNSGQGFKPRIFIPLLPKGALFVSLFYPLLPIGMGPICFFVLFFFGVLDLNI
jgi:hypothetical protein